MAVFLPRLLWSAGFLYSGLWPIFNWNAAIEEQVSRLGSFFHALYAFRNLTAIILGVYLSTSTNLMFSNRVPHVFRSLAVSVVGAKSPEEGIIGGEQIAANFDNGGQALTPNWHTVFSSILQNMSLLGAVWLFVEYERTVSKQKQKLEKIL
eukprot:Lankesteria_metandrocarpae@DN5364_c0_g1_i1.p2